MRSDFSLLKQKDIRVEHNSFRDVKVAAPYIHVQRERDRQSAQAVDVAKKKSICWPLCQDHRARENVVVTPAAPDFKASKRFHCGS